jgi:hypothetical protein
MNLNSWKGSIVRKQDIYIAKNYLNADEIDTLNRLVVIFLETAELRTKSKNIISMDFWKQNVDKVLDFNDKKILNFKGKISNAQMKQQIAKIYALFDKNRKIIEAQTTDLKELQELKKLEELEEIKNQINNSKSNEK